MNKKVALRIHGRNPEGLFHWREDLFDRASGTGAAPAAVKERSDVIGKESKGYETANYGTAELNEGMNHHKTLLLSKVVSCG